MSNRLPPDKVEALKALIVSGGSVRMAMRMLGVAKNTAIKYRRGIEVYCQCGQLSTHNGFCPFRFMSDGYEARREFMRKWKGSKDYHCVDCRKPRSGKGGSAELCCQECYDKHVKYRAFAWAAQKKECKICGKQNHRTPEGKLPPHCVNEWCERLYTFYYVEGRSRPPSAQGGSTNGLRFEFLLSDYLRRNANEIQFGS